jgi:hypothetical protein
MRIHLFILLLSVVSCSPERQDGVPITYSRKVLEFKSASPALSEDITATLSYLVLEGGSNPNILQKANQWIGPERFFDQSVEELNLAFQRGEYPFDLAEAEVVFHSHDVFQVRWRIVSTAAYTSESLHYSAVDLRTGIPIQTELMFENDTALAYHLNTLFEPLKQERLIEFLNAPLGEEFDTVSTVFENWEFDVVNLEEYLFSDLGLTFFLPSPLPHAYRDLAGEPLHLFLSWEELAPFALKDGIMSRFFP